LECLEWWSAALSVPGSASPLPVETCLNGTARSGSLTGKVSE
jgi:hypothetical protein